VKPFTIARALADERLLGAALGDLSSWQTWLCALRAAFGLDTDIATFHKIAGDRSLPTRRVRELWILAGRRSGKSRMAGAIGLYLALFQKHKLAAGEIGHVPILAASQDQARTVFSYVRGFVEASAVLRREVIAVRSSKHASEIEFKNGIVIGVHPASFRTIRGRTILGCVFDEVSYWRDEDSANPDLEVYRAVLPALIASGGMLVSISTPYRRLGLMHSKHRDFYGVADPQVLVAQADTATLNPLIDRAEIEAAYAADPEAAPSEWGGLFRDDISGFLSDDLIDAAVDHGRPLELPPRPKLRYCAFTDASAGRSDGYAVCVGHCEGERFIADVVRVTLPPFDPSNVTAEYAALLKDYRISEVRGDNYAPGWVQGAFKDVGIRYIAADRTKSVLYIESLPLFTRGLISIPDHPRLLRELRLLERRTHRSGKDSVDHGRSGHDDLANVVCACAACSATDDRDRFYAEMSWVTRDPGDPPASRRSDVIDMSRRNMWHHPSVARWR